VRRTAGVFHIAKTYRLPPGMMATAVVDNPDRQQPLRRSL
jgi:hypothetical protein